MYWIHPFSSSMQFHYSDLFHMRFITPCFNFKLNNIPLYHYTVRNRMYSVFEMNDFLN